MFISLLPFAEFSFLPGFLLVFLSGRKRNCLTHFNEDGCPREGLR